jgi:hypothetical protein
MNTGLGCDMLVEWQGKLVRVCNTGYMLKDQPYWVFVLLIGLSFIATLLLSLIFIRLVIRFLKTKEILKTFLFTALSVASLIITVYLGNQLYLLIIYL